jgi:chromate transporter
MKKCLDLFLIFCRASLFTLGGGLAMLPLIEREISEKRNWVEKEELLDIFGIAQSMPGVIILNVATCVGYKIAGILGAISAAVATVIPPFATIVCVAVFFLQIKDNPIVEKIFAGIRPAVIALIAIPVVNLSRAANINRITFIIPLSVIAAVVFLRLHPAYVVLIGIGINILYVLAKAKSK